MVAEIFNEREWKFLLEEFGLTRDKLAAMSFDEIDSLRDECFEIEGAG